MKTLASVELYCITSDSWSDAPDLNVSRCCHSSCTLGDRVYVVGGFQYAILRNLNSIEYINAEDFLAHRDGSVWVQIEVDNSTLRPRNFCIFCPVSSREIVIMGGFNWDDERDLGDVLVFDTEDETFTRLAWDGGRFKNQNNASAMLKLGKISALITHGEDHRIVNYSLGDTCFELVKEILSDDDSD